MHTYFLRLLDVRHSPGWHLRTAHSSAARICTSAHRPHSLTSKALPTPPCCLFFSVLLSVAFFSGFVMSLVCVVLPSKYLQPVPTICPCLAIQPRSRNSALADATLIPTPSPKDQDQMARRHVGNKRTDSGACSGTLSRQNQKASTCFYFLFFDEVS